MTNYGKLMIDGKTFGRAHARLDMKLAGIEGVDPVEPHLQLVSNAGYVDEPREDWWDREKAALRDAGRELT